MADVLERECAQGDDLAQMDRGCHYDYIAQRWVDGHDHAHYESDTAPLMFCGADLATCQGTREVI